MFLFIPCCISRAWHALNMFLGACGNSLLAHAWSTAAIWLLPERGHGKRCQHASRHCCTVSYHGSGERPVTASACSGPQRASLTADSGGRAVRAVDQAPEPRGRRDRRGRSRHRRHSVAHSTPNFDGSDTGWKEWVFAFESYVG